MARQRERELGRAREEEREGTDPASRAVRRENGHLGAIWKGAYRNTPKVDNSYVRIDLTGLILFEFLRKPVRI